MTAILKLADSSSTADLYSGDVKWRAQGWSTKSGRDLVWDAIELVSTGSASAIRTAVVAIDTLFERARQYRDNPLNADPVYLYWGADGEPGKRSLVYDGEMELETEGITSPLLTGTGAFMRLAVQRDPESESTAGTTLTASSVSPNAGKWPASYATGSAPARIESFSVWPGAGDVGAITNIWVGIRPTYQGTAGMLTAWECELGSNVIDSTATADAAASGGTAMVVSYTNEPTVMRERFAITLGQASGGAGNYDDIIGEYLVLGRIKVDAATTEIAVELRHAAGDLAGMESVVGTTFIDGQTSYKLFELGTVQVPPTGNRGNRASTSSLSGYAFHIYTQRVSAAGTASFDVLYLIPSRHLFSVYNCSFSPNNESTISAYTAPNYEQYAADVGGGGVIQNIEYGFTNWEWPVGGGIIVAAAQGTAHDLTLHNLNFSMTLYPHWSTYAL